MYPESYYDDNRFQQKPRDPLTLDIYPSDKEKTKFELMEDDGLTYKFKSELMYNKTLIECESNSEKNTVKIKIYGQYDGNGYDGMPEKRNYQLKLHGSKPETITIETDKLTEIKDTAALDKVADGWYFDPDKNITYIKVKTQEAKSAFSVYVSVK
jgi:hypothetical protein